jgi:hypothetical protein
VAKGQVGFNIQVASKDAISAEIKEAETRPRSVMTRRPDRKT